MTDLKRVDLTDHRDSNVAIFSNWDSKYDDLAKISMPNFAEYCNRHKYFLRGYLNYHEDPERPETYGDKGKFQCYIDLRGHFEYVMFLDVDSLFMDMDVSVEEKIRGGPFYYTFDDNGPLSGLWIARTDDLTESHLRHAYEYAAVNNNVRHGKIEPNGISDQDAFTRLMHVPPFNRTLGIQNCWPSEEDGHCYESNYTLGKWIVTFPGIPVEEKMQKISDWKEKYCV